jgi:hypothetical protein
MLDQSSVLLPRAVSTPFSSSHAPPYLDCATELSDLFFKRLALVQKVSIIPDKANGQRWNKIFGFTLIQPNYLLSRRVVSSVQKVGLRGVGIGFNDPSCRVCLLQLQPNLSLERIDPLGIPI